MSTLETSSFANFDPTLKRSIASNCKLKPSIFDPLHKTQSLCGSDTEIKSITIPRDQNYVNCHPYTEIKSNLITRNWMKSILTIHTKPRPLSLVTLKPSYIWPFHKYQATSNDSHKNHVYSETYSEIKPISISQAEIKWYPTTHIKTKLIPRSLLKPSDFELNRRMVTITPQHTTSTLTVILNGRLNARILQAGHIVQQCCGE